MPRAEAERKRAEAAAEAEARRTEAATKLDELGKPLSVFHRLMRALSIDTQN